MSELRCDRLTGDWVVIAPERQKRGSDWTASPEEVYSQKKCPFCAGHETETPPEILAIRPPGLRANGPGWKLRVVPNKFPALGGNTELVQKKQSLFPVQPGIGAHEVLIESPNHDFRIESAEIGHLEMWLAVVGQRMQAFKKEREIIYTTLFKNSGRSAGASLAHSHSQLIALPIIPNRIRREVINLEQYYRETRHCLVCDLIEKELAKKERIVYVSENYVVLIPFASRYPYETWILPLT
ncbi:galactose-1-phosphate uridylyltransferase, partial [bacterium]|nr:galactose-1-phosphate uridylyltransferase [bacterium]